MASTPELGTRRELPFVSTWKVVGTVVAWLAYVALGMWVLTLVWPKSIRPPLVEPGTCPAPRLQGDPVAEYNRLTAEQLAELGSYAWVDRGAGIVRIPIERAIDLLAARGNDAYGPLEPAPPPSPAQTARDVVDAAGRGAPPLAGATPPPNGPAMQAPTSTVPSGSPTPAPTP